MTSLKNRILTNLKSLGQEEFDSFKWQLQQPENVSGCKPLTKSALQDADTREKVVDLIVQNFPRRELEIMANILPIVHRGDLVGAFGLACSMKEPACSMREPVCLIESDSKGSLCVVPSALKILQQIEQKVVVVSVVGLYRTGKSYLMNRLAGENKGFPLGSTVQSKTKGIWMWCVPHPRKADHTLVLLDTEGLGDVEKGDTKNDNWIFAMAVLLSSTLVYNSMGTIDNTSMEKLHYVTELTKNIKMKSKAEKDDERTIARYLPSFVWAVRDFSLKLELDGTPCTENEYLEHGLKEIQGAKPQYNEPRACLRKFFQPRHCFVFDIPAHRKIMQQMEEATDAELDPEFVEQAKKFTEHIYTKSGAKFVGDGIKVTGRILGQLAETYVEAIRSGDVPCLENAVVALAEIENARAVEQARVLYVKGMESVRFPTKTMEELSAIHASSEREAWSLFRKRSFRDDNQEYQKKLVSALQGEYNQISEKNIKESRKACEQIIQRVFKSLENKVGAGLYSVPGGYVTFCQDLEVMTGTYRRAEGGVKAEEVLKTYLDEKATVGTAILAADKRLSEAQRRAEEDKAKWEKAERERLATEEKRKALEVEMAQQRKTEEEHIKQLNDKMEKYKKDADDNHAKAAEQRILAQQRAEEDKAKWEKAERETLATEEKRKATEEKLKALEVKMAQQRAEVGASSLAPGTTNRRDLLKFGASSLAPGTTNRRDLLKFGASSLAPGTTNRRDLLKYSSPLSLDPNTAYRKLLLSKNNRRVTYTAVAQPYADHPDRFTYYSNVLSRESLSGPSYFEVQWSGKYVGIAVCQDDVNRKDMGLSWFGATPQSWALRYSDSRKRYVFRHNSIPTEVSGPVPSTGGSHRVGVYVDPKAGVLCYYGVCGNTMSLLHTERTTFTRPLYAGIGVMCSATTAEVCEIW